MSNQLMWFLHNVVSHPLMGILSLLGFENAAAAVHDVTLPAPSAGGEVILNDEVVKVIKIDDKDITSGQYLTELITLSKGKFAINRHPYVPKDGGEDRMTWVVSYEVDNEWKQERAHDLNEALEAAIDRCLENIDLG